MVRAHVQPFFALVFALFFATSTAALARQAPDDIMVLAGVPGEILAEIEIPADALPDGPTVAVMGRFTWQPNTTDGVPAGAFEKGVLVETVREGSYALRSGGPVLVARHGVDGPPEQAAAGTEVVLATGDTVAYLQNDESWDFRNASPAEPGMALNAMIISTDPPALGVESEVDPEHVDEELSLHLDILGRAEPEAWADGVGSPLRVTLWRAELAAGASIPAPDAEVVQVVAPESAESPELVISADGSAQNDGPDVIAVFGFTITDA